MLHTLGRSTTDAAEFIDDAIGGTQSNEVDRDNLEWLRNLAHTIRTDLQSIGLIILADDPGTRDHR